MILGIGGVRALRMLGLQPAVWHLNEGHAAFLILELVREHLAPGCPSARRSKRLPRNACSRPTRRSPPGTTPSDTA